MTLVENDVDAALEWAAALGSELEIAVAKAHIALALLDVGDNIPPPEE